MQQPETSVEGKPYSHNTMKAVRSGVTNVFLVPAQRKPFSIIQDKVIKPANEPLDASLKDLARQFPAKTLKLYMQQISLA